MTASGGFDALSWRPTLVGRECAVASGHYLATLAAQRVLDAGGNAIDAGVTAAMALAVLQPDIVSFAGVAPTLIYLEKEARVISLAGLGPWPAATDVGRLRREGGEAIPEGIVRTVVPAAPATHVEALRRWGTLTFEQAVAPALELARHGFYLYPFLHHGIESHAADFDRYVENRGIFRPNGQTPPVGSLLRQENLARTLWRLAQAERSRRGDRDAKLRAVHDCFYRGPIAAEIAGFHAREGGFLTRADLARFEVPVEAPIACRYKQYTVYSGDTWCQGIVLLEALKILERIDLPALGFNSSAYIHTVAEALNLAFADREAYVGDPKFVAVPVAGLLSDDYARSQLGRIDPNRAFGAMPQPGSPPGATAKPPVAALRRAHGEVPAPADTIYACVADRLGNAYSATLSDTSYDNPMVPGMGLSVSSRGSQSRLEPEHPACVAPGKRPRMTPSPALVLANGRFSMAFGTPGGDIQSQAMLQVFLNVNEHGMSLQQAIEAPRFGTFSFPNSFAPHTYLPGRLCAEGRIAQDSVADLERLGHEVERWGMGVWLAGAVCAIRRDPETGLLHAGADPRREAYALAW
ncbi:MAG: gamma-glutamyltransferase [Burkholderiales bacterium]|nr:gamma-glutamyltransferase [Burkholderiales bacterium]